MYWDDKYGTHSVSAEACSHLLLSCELWSMAMFFLSANLWISLIAGCCQNEGHGEQRCTKSSVKFISLGWRLEVSAPKMSMSFDCIRLSDLYIHHPSYLTSANCSIPFTTEEIAEEVPDIDMSNIEMPSSLRHVHSAQFLMQHLQTTYPLRWICLGVLSDRR